MKFIAEIDVMPLKDVRIGKHIQMVLECVDEAKAKEEVEKACQKILTNPIMESYTYVLTPQ